MREQTSLDNYGDRTSRWSVALCQQSAPHPALSVQLLVQPLDLPLGLPNGISSWFSWGCDMWPSWLPGHPSDNSMCLCMTKRHQIHSSWDTRSPILSVSTVKSVISFLLRIAKVGLFPPKYSIRHSPCGLTPILPYIKCCMLASHPTMSCIVFLLQ